MKGVVYISLDKNLIQENNNSIRFDILGLVKGTYEVKIKVNESECIISNIIDYKNSQFYNYVVWRFYYDTSTRK